jgi:predicted tellurium resistance membrane protein TerC
MILINSTCLLLLSIIYEFTVGLISLKIDPRKITKTLYISGIICCLFFSTQSWLLSSAAAIIFIQGFFYIFAVGCLPLTPILIKSYPTRHRLKCHMWGLALVTVISFVLTAYVCEKLNNINLLLLVMAGAAGVSLTGVYLFKAYDDGMTKEEKQSHHVKLESITENIFFKWQKSRKH